MNASYHVLKSPTLLPPAVQIAPKKKGRRPGTKVQQKKDKVIAKNRM